MHYQVVIRSSESSGIWKYYPYWSPVREKDAAERLAGYAAQSGFEAAILQGVTSEMLKNIANRVVEQHETELLPSLRYLPGSPAGLAGGKQSRTVETLFPLSPALEPYIQGGDKAELDRRRLRAELGPGGDIVAYGTVQPDAPLPLRMDIVSAWLRLREQVLSGEIGGDCDGAPEDEANAYDR